MTWLVLLLLQFTVLVSVADSIDEAKYPKDNSHYVKGKTRYVWVPDDETGKLHLVDLHDPVLKGGNPDIGEDRNSYWLYTKRNPKEAQILQHGHVKSAMSSNYNPNELLHVIVHGWKSYGNGKGSEMVRSAIVNVTDCNVIILDWNYQAKQRYKWVTMALPHVAKRLALFIDWLYNKVGGHPGLLHLIGFGLGAHLVGFAGTELSKIRKIRPNRITALDPADAYFSNGPGLNTHNVRYVEVIHTDISGAGTDRPLGDADFYPNGGQHQTGCKGKEKSGCSHKRAFQYFTVSILYGDILKGNKCKDLVEAKLNRCKGSRVAMGTITLGKTAKGLYAMTTLPKWPYAKYHSKRSRLTNGISSERNQTSKLPRKNTNSFRVKGFTDPPHQRRFYDNNVNTAQICICKDSSRRQRRNPNRESALVVSGEGCACKE